MNIRQIVHFMQEPASMTETDVALFDELISQYSYFQTAYILLAKIYHNNGHFRFSQSLKSAAVFTPNKQVLFELMPPAFGYGHTSSKNVIKDTKPVSEERQTNKSISGDVEVNEFYTSHKKALDQLEQRLSALGKKKVNESFPKTNLVEEENKISKETGIIESAIDIPLNITVDIEKEALYAIEIATIEELPHVEEPIEDIKSNLATHHPSELHSFLEWLNTGANKQRIENHKAKDKTQQAALIEKFIHDEPRIGPAKTPFYSSTNMARKSVNENDEIVSETLAKIYVAQGNYQRAIKIYEKLSLLYPEKNSLFAALIKEFNEKIIK